ncbi:hypothetical protein F5Y15DRAFT_381605 [Xylariaceae sp. FL0016]|nr:hypothetical protein F5Y15DRAFT_381605 [Xylariaceae sp. FL0016]
MVRLAFHLRCPSVLVEALTGCCRGQHCLPMNGATKSIASAWPSNVSHQAENARPFSASMEPDCFLPRICDVVDQTLYP